MKRTLHSTGWIAYVDWLERAWSGAPHRSYARVRRNDGAEGGAPLHGCVRTAIKADTRRGRGAFALGVGHHCLPRTALMQSLFGFGALSGSGGFTQQPQSAPGGRKWPLTLAPRRDALHDARVRSAERRNEPGIERAERVRDENERLLQRLNDLRGSGARECHRGGVSSAT